MLLQQKRSWAVAHNHMHAHMKMHKCNSTISLALYIRLHRPNETKEFLAHYYNTKTAAWCESERVLFCAGDAVNVSMICTLYVIRTHTWVPRCQKKNNN